MIQIISHHQIWDILESSRFDFIDTRENIERNNTVIQWYELNGWMVENSWVERRYASNYWKFSICITSRSILEMEGWFDPILCFMPSISRRRYGMRIYVDTGDRTEMYMLISRETNCGNGCQLWHWLHFSKLDWNVWSMLVSFYCLVGIVL